MRPAEIADMTDYQLQMIYFAPRDPKTGAVLLPSETNQKVQDELAKPMTREEAERRMRAVLTALGINPDPPIQRWRERRKEGDGHETR